MTTTAFKKTVVEPTWTLIKVQEEAARAAATAMVTTMTVLAKHGEKAVEEFRTEMHKHKLAHFKTLNVKTPYDLVKAIAEFETNVFGSKIEIWGDEKEAGMTYQNCAMWNAISKIAPLTPEQEEKMGKDFGTCMTTMADKLGFKTTIEMGKEVCTINFKK